MGIVFVLVIRTCSSVLDKICHATRIMISIHFTCLLHSLEPEDSSQTYTLCVINGPEESRKIACDMVKEIVERCVVST